MASKGYAASTLSDIAAEADMSSSHLLYYYPGKEAIVADYFDTVCERFKREVTGLPPDPEQKLDAFADLFLGPRRSDRTERTVMLDLFGQTVQNRTMRRAKAAHDRFIRAELEKVFKQTPRTPGSSAHDAAQTAYAMLMGLRTNSFYDTSLTAVQTHRLFRQTLFQLAGIKVPKARKRRGNTEINHGRSAPRPGNRSTRGTRSAARVAGRTHA